MNQYLRKELDQYTLIMCPTEYWQNYDTPYRQDLKNNLDQNIKVFWTGYKVVPEYLPNKDGYNAQKFFGHELVLWENYPVNDMAPDKLFMGPIENRGDELHRSHIGLISNPMIKWSLSIIPIMTMADYMWDPSKYDKEESYNKAVMNFCGTTKIYQSMINILENFRISIISYYKNENIEEYLKNNDIDSLILYYKSILEDINIVKQLKNKRFLEQINPWFKRFEFDFNLLILYKKNSLDELKTNLQLIEKKENTINSNYAVRYLKNIGIYKGKLFKKERINNWE